MKPERSRRRLWRNLAIGASVLAAVVIGFLLVFDWNWLKGPIERRVSAATGRSLQIDGKDLYLGVNAYVYAKPKGGK